MPEAMIALDPPVARQVVVAAQGLDRRPSGPVNKSSVLDAIRRMGALQIDTIHVVARSPYLVLFSRLGCYDPGWLDSLLAEGALFEYWAHAASFLPIEDYALFRHRMLRESRDHGGHTQAWLDMHHEEAAAVIARLREAGAVKAADFEGNNHRGGSWWQWKPEKRILEALFNTGEVMIARRERFQRVYDLRERLLPDWDDAQALSEEQARLALVARTVKALGLVAAPWIADYYRLNRHEIAPVIEQLQSSGEVHAVAVAGWPTPVLAHRDQLPLVQMAVQGTLDPTLTTLLSPFDPLVWDRHRAKAVFDFDYRIECYTPAPKRRYGYFSLPILRRGDLVGRVDAKAHRKEGRFAVIALHLEPRIEVDDALVADLAGALIECAAWHSTPQVTVLRTDPAHLSAELAASGLAHITDLSYDGRHE